jgi:hypothetical protein
MYLIPGCWSSGDKRRRVIDRFTIVNEVATCVLQKQVLREICVGKGEGEYNNAYIVLKWEVILA